MTAGKSLVSCFGLAQHERRKRRGRISVTPAKAHGNAAREARRPKSIISTVSGYCKPRLYAEKGKSQMDDCQKYLDAIIRELNKAAEKRQKDILEFIYFFLIR